MRVPRLGKRVLVGPTDEAAFESPSARLIHAGLIPDDTDIGPDDGKSTIERHRGAQLPADPCDTTVRTGPTRRLESVPLASLVRCRKSERFEVRIGEGHKERAFAPSEIPRTATVSTRLLASCGPPFAACARAATTLVAAAGPAGQVHQRVRRFAEAEIVPPTPPIYGASSSIVVSKLTPLARRLIYRPLALNRELSAENEALDIRTVKLKPREFLSSGRATVLAVFWRASR